MFEGFAALGYKGYFWHLLIFFKKQITSKLFLEQFSTNQFLEIEFRKREITEASEFSIEPDKLMLQLSWGSSYMQGTCFSMITDMF